jgi:hypothetical protein
VKLYDVLRRMFVISVEHPRSAFDQMPGMFGAVFVSRTEVELSMRVLMTGPDAVKASELFVREIVAGRQSLAPTIAPSDALADLLRRDHAGITSVLRELSPDALARLTVAVDAAQSGRSLAEYRSPADVAKIAELEAAARRELYE